MVRFKDSQIVRSLADSQMKKTPLDSHLVARSYMETVRRSVFIPVSNPSEQSSPARSPCAGISFVIR